MNHRLQPRPGFNWMRVSWGGPDEIRTEPAVEAYLRRKPMTSEHMAAMRAYLRQWIMAPAWMGPEVEDCGPRSTA